MRPEKKDWIALSQSFLLQVTAQRKSEDTVLFNASFLPSFPLFFLQIRGKA